MRIPGIGPLELVIILVVVLLIFGPKNLPKLGASLGKTVKNVKEGMKEETTEPAAVEVEEDDEPAEDEEEYEEEEEEEQ